MSITLELISTRKPWIFISLGIQNEDTLVMEESKLFPKNSIVMIKEGNEDNTFPNDIDNIINKTCTIGNICDTLNDTNVKINRVEFSCHPTRIKNHSDMVCKIYVSEITPILKVGGSKSKFRKTSKSRKSRKNKRSNKNKSKKRNSKH